MKKLLLAVASATVLLAALSANAQHGPSAYFGGNTRLYNPGSLGGPSISKSFACYFQHNTEEAISSVVFDTSGYLNPALIVAFVKQIGLGEDAIHLAIASGDFAGNHGWSMISQTPVPINKWSPIAFTVTTSLHLVAASIDGHSVLFDDIYGSDTGPYYIPVRGNRWMVGDALGPAPILPKLMLGGRFMGVAVLPYKGALDQLTCKFKDDAYADILTPYRKGLGFMESVMLGDSRIIFRPLDLGPHCSMPWRGESAELCMREDAIHFPQNNGGSTAFSTIGDPLIDYVDSPFKLWYEP